MNKEQETAYKQLKDWLATINDLHSAKSLLFWDHQTYMPRGGVPNRAEQVATLSRLAHEMVTDDEMERLLKASGEPDPCSEDGALIPARPARLRAGDAAARGAGRGDLAGYISGRVGLGKGTGRVRLVALCTASGESPGSKTRSG